jgi:hypothetical protein
MEPSKRATAIDLDLHEVDSRPNRLESPLRKCLPVLAPAARSRKPLKRNQIHRNGTRGLKFFPITLTRISQGEFCGCTAGQSDGGPLPLPIPTHAQPSLAALDLARR